ncbi:MAG: hypothetical protein JXK05_10005 [Campylobacterales bacterium]|nr:hypothetical protein [Campylobacterales bacterium]
MHTLSIKIDDSIYEHFKQFLSFYPKNKLDIIEDDEELTFGEAQKQAYEEAVQELEQDEAIDSKSYASQRNL